MVNKKVGQAAMEYLMTYGWALLVIVIVIAILLIMNPFSSPQSCRFDQVGFSCEAPAVEASSSLMYMKLMNGNNDAIKLYGVMCTQSKSTTLPSWATIPTTVITTVQKQDTYTIAPVQCFDANGALIPTNTLKKGTDFSGKIWVFYRNNEDPTTGYPLRTSSATLTTKAV